MLHGLAMQKEEDWAYRLLSEVSYVLDDPLYSHITHKEDAYKYWDYTLDIPTMDAGSARDYLNAAAMIGISSSHLMVVVIGIGRPIRYGNRLVMTLPIRHCRLFLKSNR